MRIQLDTNQKTIKVEESVNLDEFMKAVKKLFPNNEWKEYRLETNTIINWTYPIVYEPYKVYPWWETNPYISPGTITYKVIDITGASTESYSGVYNIQMQ